MLSLECFLSGTYNPAERAREKGEGKGVGEADPRLGTIIPVLNKLNLAGKRLQIKIKGV